MESGTAKRFMLRIHLYKASNTFIENCISGRRIFAQDMDISCKGYRPREYVQSIYFIYDYKPLLVNGYKAVVFFKEMIYTRSVVSFQLISVNHLRASSHEEK